MAGMWEPDWAVPEAVMSRRLRYRDLGNDDRRWAVAELSHRGFSVGEIAGWLDCSTRQVKRVRADLATRVMAAYARERDRADGVTRHRRDCRDYYRAG